MIFNDIILPCAHTHAVKNCLRRVINGFSSHNVTRCLRLKRNLLILKSEALAQKKEMAHVKKGVDGVEITSEQ